MSIAELGGGYAGPDERVPPQDMSAEQSVLGSMLLNKDAIAESLQSVKAHDFYRPAHESIFSAILDLFGRGEPADAITVADELTKRGELARIGGASYLHELVQAVPTAANASYYAEIVHERAVLRRLVEAGTRIVQMGYGQGEGDVEDIVNRAQAEVYAVAEKRGGEDYVILSEVLDQTLTEIEAAAGRTDEMIGVPTGFIELDELTHGLHPGQMIVVAARPAVGKALALDTPLPTPTGWTTMGEVAVGDQLIDAHGRPTTVVAATEVMEGRPCFEVEFSDGSVIVADAEHQWAIEGGQVVTTQFMVDLGLRPKVLRDVRYVEDIRAVASVAVRCVEVDNAEHLYLAGAGRVPTHNSTLGIDIARAAAIKHNLTTAVFSLEMSRTEITMRILSAEATIQLQDLRKGLKGQEQWNKLARIMGKIGDAPLFIDDSPNMSLMEIRAKARRLKQQHNLKLVIIDYLQLMTSGKKVESRQQEVAEFSRALKLLAKELEVPVIAISQLNRGPEQRTDKRPQMSDLRESGCLPAETRILRADTGAEVTIGELARSGERDITVWALDDGLRYTKRTMTHAFSTGTKPVFRLTTASGKTVRATANHPFLTPSGWKPLADLDRGDKIAVARHVPSPAMVTPGWTDADVYAAALSFPSTDPEHVIPDEIFCLPKEQIATYLNLVWEFSGRITAGEGPSPIVAWNMSRRSLEGIARLLLRFGIQTIHETHRCEGDPLLYVDGVDSVRRFLQEIGSPHKEREDGEELLDSIRWQGADLARIDAKVWSDLERTLSEHGDEGDQGQVALLTRVESSLAAGEMELSATNDVAWEPIWSVEPDGVEEVYDATVLDCHNFIANGVAVHNSIEQDADVVILLHRDRSDPERDGEADVIVAKHRNGPTKDIVLAFQGHYSRFNNMAREGGF